jgi:EAL domain-containing protein (putative c-di-GMP-specific phosphodiesterase class I)
VKLNLVIAALIASPPLRHRVQALAAEHASIWQPLADAAALRAVLDGAGPEPDLVITDTDAADVMALLNGRALVFLGSAGVAGLPAGAVALAPGEVSAPALAEAMVSAVNLARTTSLIYGLEQQQQEVSPTSTRWGDHSGFEIQFQPQWSIDGRHVTAAEALLRWHGMEVAALRPESYIAAAEADGQIALLGDWILERACELAGAWLADWPESMVLAVNVTPAQLGAPAFIEVALQAVTGHGLDPALVDFELSALDLPVLAAQQAERLHQLHSLGFGFTLDRVGSSVFDPKLLRALPLRTLKVDRSLVGRLETDPSARLLVEQLAQLAMRLGLNCTAVGIETDGQRDLLQTTGFDALQGRLLADAMPAGEFGALLKAQRERRQPAS